jgi:hypothetical protein
MPFQTHNPRLSDEWTVARIALLLKLDAENVLSRSQIAIQLHNETGSRFTRNAIIGKLARLGAPLKGKLPARSKPLRSHPPRVERMRTYIPRPPPEPAPDSLRTSLVDLTETTCRYPTNPENQTYEACGHPMYARSYCAAHFGICYQSMTDGQVRRTNKFACEGAQ